MLLSEGMIHHESPSTKYLLKRLCTGHIVSIAGDGFNDARVRRTNDNTQEHPIFAGVSVAVSQACRGNLSASRLPFVNDSLNPEPKRSFLVDIGTTDSYDLGRIRT